MFLVFKSNILLIKSLTLARKSCNLIERSPAPVLLDAIPSLLKQTLSEIDKSYSYLQEAIATNKQSAITINAVSLWVSTVSASTLLFSCANWSGAKNLINTNTNDCTDALIQTQWTKETRQETAQKLVESYKTIRQHMLDMIDLRETLIGLEKDPDNQELKIHMQELKAKFNTMKKTEQMDPRAEKVLIHLYFQEDDLAQQIIDQMNTVDTKGKNDVLYERNMNSGLSEFAFGRKFLDLLQARLDYSPTEVATSSLNKPKVG